MLLFRVNTVSYYLLQEAREAPKTKYNTADFDYNLNDEDVLRLSWGIEVVTKTIVFLARCKEIQGSRIPRGGLRIPGSW